MSKSEQATSSAVDLKKILAIEHLPGMPQTAVRLLELSQNPSNGPAEFAACIETDPGLTVQVLRFVNSSYFGFRSEISGIKQAVTMVGVRTIKNFTLWSAVFNILPNPRCGLFDMKGLWQDSLRRGIFARSFARLLGMKETEEPFAAALLQDMAVPLLAKEVPDTYNRLFNARRDSENRVRLSRLEQYAFGWNHAQAAGIMARQWKLPQSLGSLIEDHLAIERLAANPEPELGKLAVAMSALLPSADETAWHELPEFETYFGRFRPANGPALTEILADVDTEFKEIAPILRLPAPKTPLVDIYQASVTSAAAGA